VNDFSMEMTLVNDFSMDYGFGDLRINVIRIFMDVKLDLMLRDTCISCFSTCETLLA
jgi:hypothetical protein